MDGTAVMQVVDTLELGGLERVAVNIANALPPDRFPSHLCTTRRRGPLADSILPRVRQLHLNRQSRFDLRALHRLTVYIREQDIRLLHAHGTSLFFAVAASCRTPRCKVIWHDHWGGFQEEKRIVWPYWLAARRLAGVVVVNHPLAQWSRQHLGMPSDRVWYIPNFVNPAPPGQADPSLPGSRGSRIVCVANLRPAKDHRTLLAAMRRVVRQFPQAHLLLVGGTAPDSAEYAAQVQREIAEPELAGQVTWLGACPNVPAVLQACDIGVLSSAYEGLPMALIEYGMAGLATVCTRVGQCADVLAGGQAGHLVSPKEPQQLADALLALLSAPEQRRQLAARFQQRIHDTYSREPVLQQICAAYDRVLPTRPDRADPVTNPDGRDAGNRRIA